MLWSWTRNFIIALRTLNEFAHNVVSSRMPYGIIGFQLTIKKYGQQWSMASTLWGTFGDQWKLRCEWRLIRNLFSDIVDHYGGSTKMVSLKANLLETRNCIVHRRHSIDQIADFWIIPWSWPRVWMESNKRKSWLSQWSCIKRHLKENGLTTRPLKFCTAVVAQDFKGKAVTMSAWLMNRRN